MTRWLRKPPGWLLLGLAVLIGVTLCATMVAPGGGMSVLGVYLLALVGGFVVAACWLFRTIACAVTSRRFYFRMLAVPVVLITTMAMLQFEVPQRARFAAAKGGFEDAVTSIENGETPADFHRRIGTYEVDSVFRRGRNIYFFIDDGGFSGRQGLAYLPDGPPDPPERFDEVNTVRPLDAPWYRFASDW